MFGVCTYYSESALQTLNKTFIIDDSWLEIKMGMLARTVTTCARVILMALTGDGSMSTSCCTELSVWTRSKPAIHPHTKAEQCIHKDTEIKGRGYWERTVDESVKT